MRNRLPKNPTSQQRRRARLVSNRLLGLVRQAQSSMLDNLGNQIAIGKTSSWEDSASAQVGTDLLTDLRRRLRWRERRAYELLTALLMGRGLVKIFWDTRASGEGPNGRIDGAGEVGTVSLTPLEFLIDPWHARFADMDFVIEVAIRDVAELKEMFGKEVHPEAVQPVGAAIDRMLGMIADRARQTPPTRENAALHKIVHFRPSQDHPNGLVIHWANGVTLHESDLPDQIFPFEEVHWFSSLGPYPIPFASPLVPLNYAYSQHMSQIIELANKQLRGDMIAIGGRPRLHVNEDTGQRVLELPEGASTTFMDYKLNPTTAEFMLMTLWNDSQQIAGLRTMLGENPRNARTVGQLMLLQQSDISGLSMFRMGFDDSYTREAEMVVHIAEKHYKRERMIRLVGPNDTVKAQSLYGSYLKGISHVKVRYVPAMTEMERRTAIKSLVDTGKFSNVGPDGKFSLDIMEANVKAILHSGIPDIEHELERWIAPFTMAELEDIFAMHRGKQIRRSITLDTLEDAAVQDAFNPPAPQSDGGPSLAPGQESGGEPPIGLVPPEQIAAAQQAPMAAGAGGR